MENILRKNGKISYGFQKDKFIIHVNEGQKNCEDDVY